MALLHHKSKIGEFDYDTEMFEAQEGFLHLREGYKGAYRLT